MTIEPVTLLLIGVLALAVLLLPRHLIMVPFVLAACFIPADQRVLLGTLDFTALRVLVVMGGLRLWLAGEIRPLKVNLFDQIVVLWALSGAIVYVIQWGDLDALINRAGVLFDLIGLYWIFRQLLVGWPDIERLTKAFAICAVIMAPVVLVEWTTGRNYFRVLGNVQTVIREGRMRSQGAFPHSIMMGLFWCSLLPLFIGMAWVTRKSRWWLASGAAAFMVIATASSTPVATLLQVLVLLALYRYRHLGKQAVYAMLGMTVLLHLAMKAPVWHLLSRISLVGGSTGYHRYRLIDEAVEHWHEWVLLGTRSTAHWAWGLADVTNQYILEGVRGGLVTMIVFIVMLVMAVRVSGRASLVQRSPRLRIMSWCLCVAVLSHCLGFIGVSYFGQIKMLLCLTLAAVSMVYSLERRTARSRAPRAVRIPSNVALSGYSQLEYTRNPAGLPPQRFR